MWSIYDKVIADIKGPVLARISRAWILSSDFVTHKLLDPVSTWICRLTVLRISFIKIRRPHDCIVFILAIPLPGKDRLYSETWLASLSLCHILVLSYTYGWFLNVTCECHAIWIYIICMYCTAIKRVLVRLFSIAIGCNILFPYNRGSIWVYLPYKRKCRLIGWPYIILQKSFSLNNHHYDHLCLYVLRNSLIYALNSLFCISSDHYSVHLPLITPYNSLRPTGIRERENPASEDNSHTKQLPKSIPLISWPIIIL